MLRKRGLSLAATALGAIAMLFVTAGDAQARRGFYRGPVRSYYSPYSYGRYNYGPRAYRTGYRGYDGYYGRPYGGYYGRGGGVMIGGPRGGVVIGW